MTLLSISVQRLSLPSLVNQSPLAVTEMVILQTPQKPQ
jgi:hypothetical protein